MGLLPASLIPASGALLGLLSASTWGIADFAGGMGVKAAGGKARSGLQIVVLSHVSSLGVLLLLSFTLGGPMLHGKVLLWALAAGVLAGLSLSAFYVALSRGAMGASAAVSGLLAAAIPAAVSSFADGAPGWRHGLGFVVAAVAIWLIAAGSGNEHQDKQGTREQGGTMLLAIGAGAGFGLYFTALRFAGVNGVLWPMTMARVGSICTCTVILLVLSSAATAGPVLVWRVFRWALLTALFDTSGNLLFVAATRAGRLDVAAVVASLYPASTILLAGVVLREKLTRRQVTGMLMAVGAVVLVAG